MLFLARDIVWGPSDVWDYQKFPARVVNNAPPAFQFKENLQPALFQAMTVAYQQDGEVKQTNLEELLKSRQTTSLIVIKDDAILYEGYFNGYNRDSIVTSFSMAKSVTPALIGIAIDEGLIGSVDAPIVTYLPEMRGKGLDDLTIRHLLLMASGIRYVSDDEITEPAQLSPFSDDGLRQRAGRRVQLQQLQPNVARYYPGAPPICRWPNTCRRRSGNRWVWNIRRRGA